MGAGIGYFRNNEFPWICGGLDCKSDLATSNCYFYRKGVWTLNSFMHSKRAYSGYATTQEAKALYVSGGNDTDMLDSMEYSTPGGWSLVSSKMPVTIVRHCMERVNSKLIVVGGVTRPSTIRIVS